MADLKVLEFKTAPEFVGPEVLTVAERWQSQTISEAAEKYASHPVITHQNDARSRLIGRYDGLEAILSFCGAGTDPGNLGVVIQGAFISEVLYEAGITNGKGDPLPFIAFGMATSGYGVLKERADRALMRRGNVDAFGAELLWASNERYPRFARFGTTGGSLGSIAALSVFTQLPRHFDQLGGDFKDHPAVAAEPEGLRRKFGDFAKLQGLVEDEVKSGIVAPYVDNFGFDHDYTNRLTDALGLDAKQVRKMLDTAWGVQYFGRLVASLRRNLALGKMLTLAMFEPQLADALASPGNEPMTFTTGMDSSMSNYGLLSATIPEVMLRFPDSRHNVQSIGLYGKEHVWLLNLLLNAESSLRAYSHLRSAA